MNRMAFCAILLACAQAAPALAETARPVAGQVKRDPERLFTSKDPKLHRNKQFVLKMLRELVNCGQWEKASQFMTDRYVQHNPLIGQGRDAVGEFFTKELKAPRVEKCGKLDWPVEAVIAEGDYVTVMMNVRYPNPNKPGEFYRTAWFDTWRFRDGMVDEHWDGQKLCPGLTPGQCVSELNPSQ